jgi:trimeric autotransporter adhesin
LTCAVTPAAASDPATCSLSPASVTVSGTTAQTSTLTITTTAATSAQRESPENKRTPWYPAAALACVVLCGLCAKRRRWQHFLGIFFVLALVTAFFAGCGGGGSSSGGGGGGSKSTGDPGTTAGTYTVTVTGTSGSATETTSVSVVVN